MCQCNDCSGVELPIGPQGAVGAVGATGPAGADGAEGPQGDTGPQGDPGPAGADGLDGAAGAAGIDGEDGILFQLINLPGTTTRFFEVAAGTSVAEAYKFIYPGSTTHEAPTNIKIIAKGNGGVAQMTITIQDETNVLNWIPATVVALTSSFAIYDLGVPSNISLTESLINIIIEETGTVNGLTAISLFINYV